MGHSSQTNLFQRRMKCRGIFRRRFLNSTEHIRDTVQMRTSFHQQQDGQPAMSNSPMYARRRYTPYGIPSRHQRINLYKQNQMRVNREEEPTPPERKMQKDKQDDDTSKNWFKVTIPSGIKYDKKWLLNLIQSQCSIPFTPVEFHYEKMQAQFFVDNSGIAFELKSISDEIWDESNNKISIFISPCDEPHSVTELKSEKMDQTKPQSHRTPSVILQLAMNLQVATSQQVLNMQRLPFDQGMTDSHLMTYPTDLALKPGRYMAPSLDIHEEDMAQVLPLNQSYSKSYPLFGLLDTMAMAPPVDNLNISKNEVKSAGERVKGQDPNPEEICADKNSLSTTVLDKPSNINSILELFPKLLSLDGQESPKPTLCGLEDHKSLPTCKGSFFGSKAVKTLVLQFLHQYYFIYDNGDRQGLLNAYHAEACFSLTVLFGAVDSSSSSLWEYFKYSRNMKVLKDSYIRRQLLKHKKCDIIYFLRTLPKTQHDLTSFVVDICFQTETMICFSVSGLFKEVEGSSQGCAHAFTRTFIATYGNSSDLHIINDKLFVRNVQGLPSASIPVATLPALSQDQQKMVQSGMNAEGSQKCLNDEQCDYNKAIQSLALLKVRDVSPEDTSIQPGPRS
ncbi:nuclear RNA export factor 3-like [Peromyscus eremicus]|uniref:nuclear RNA export factor 3-like n=1 Tax=Peromyscus eremicus TaxID=42410 RepID=UPI0027DD8530|nr:nuclear RNA export factor 3-like [Peromyscus eremicus]